MKHTHSSYRPLRAGTVLGLVALLAACSTAPRSSAPMPTSSTFPPYQSSTPAVQADYGRVTAIDPLRTQEQGQGTGAGAVIGGVAGNTVERNARGQWRESYRIMVQLESGINRAYEVPTPGDLRVGDRVRIENNQIFRM